MGFEYYQVTLYQKSHWACCICHITDFPQYHLEGMKFQNILPSKYVKNVSKVQIIILACKQSKNCPLWWLSKLRIILNIIVADQIYFLYHSVPLQ